MIFHKKIFFLNFYNRENRIIGTWRVSEICTIYELSNFFYINMVERLK